ADARRQGADGHSNIAAAATTQVITPRRTRLVRVPDLHHFRRAIVELAAGAVTAENPEREPRTPNPEPPTPTPLAVRPTRRAPRPLKPAVDPIDPATRDRA